MPYHLHRQIMQEMKALASSDTDLLTARPVPYWPKNHVWKQRHSGQPMGGRLAGSVTCWRVKARVANVPRSRFTCRAAVCVCLFIASSLIRFTCRAVVCVSCFTCRDVVCFCSLTRCVAARTRQGVLPREIIGNPALVKIMIDRRGTFFYTGNFSASNLQVCLHCGGFTKVWTLYHKSI